MTEVAHGTVGIEVDQAGLDRGLREAEAKFDRSMADIGRKKAAATVELKMAKFDQQVADAKRKVRELEGGRASMKLDADKEIFDEKIAAAKEAVKRLDGQRATVELELKGREKVVRALSEVQAQEARMAAARAKFSDEQDKAQRRQTIGISEQAAQVARLQQQYARLTDKLESINKRQPIAREARAKATLDAGSTILQMEALKAKLNELGAHPPIDIKADLDRNTMQRVGEQLAKITDKVGALGTTTIRLGPFTTTLKGLVSVLSVLGPTLTDVGGAAVSLVGVLGGGLAGAATVGAGALTGLLGVGLGLKMSMRNVGQEVTNARSAINAYQKAEEAYGKGSPQAQKKLLAMNNTLKNISPLARETALGVEKFYSTWDKHTGSTRNNLGDIAKSGFKALNDLTPMWAARTNQFSGMLSHGLQSAFKFMDQGQGRGLMDGIMGDFNAVVPTLLHSVGSIGHAFLNFGRDGARNLGTVTTGIDHLATKLLDFTQRDTFGATVKNWVREAMDISRFFGAAARVVTHFFGNSAQAGDNFVNDMTRGLNKWDAKLTSVTGKNKFGDFFQHAVTGTEKLWGTLAPIGGAFLTWAANMAPVAQLFFTVTGFAARLLATITRITGMGGVFTTAAATMGAIFAVGKVTAFAAAVSRVVTLMKEARAAGSVMAGIKTFGSGFGGALKGDAGIAAGGAEAAAAIRAGIVEGGASAAAEIRAAMIGGGAAAGAESAAGAAAGGAAGVAEGAGAAAGAGALAAETGAVATGAEAAAAGVGALTLGAVALPLALTAGVIGLGYLASKLIHTHTAVDDLGKALKGTQTELHNAHGAFDSSSASVDRSTAAIHREKSALKDAEEQLKNTKKGTLAHRDAELNLYDARARLQKSYDDRRTAARNEVASVDKETNSAREQALEVDKLGKAKVKAAQDAAMAQRRQTGNPNAGQDAIDNAEAAAATANAAAQRLLTAALNEQAAARLNVARAARGQQQVTGQNAQNLGALQRQAPTVAQAVSIKYTAANDAGSVAAAATRALGQGVSQKVVMRIVADSSSAEQALRRIRTQTVDAKMLRVGITGHDGVMSKLSAIDQKRIRQKIANIIQHGGEPTISKINQIIAMQVRDKSFAVTANVSQAIAQVDLMAAGLSRIQSKSIVISATTRMAGFPHASGRGPGNTERALVGEGGGPEWIVNPKRGSAFKTNGAMVMDLAPEEYVIPTESAHAGRGRALLADAARDLGIPGFKKGRARKPLPIIHNDSLSSDYFDQMRQDDTAAYNKKAGDANSYEKRVASDEAALKGVESKPVGKGKGAAASHKHSVDTARAKLARDRRHLNADLAAIPALQKRQRTSERYYTQYTQLKNDIEAETTRMNGAAIEYNRTGSQDALDRWRGDRDQRGKNYEGLRKMILAAQKRAGSKWQSELTTQLATTGTDIQSALSEADPTAPDVSMAFIDVLKRGGFAGLDAGTLGALQAANAVAGTTSDPNDDIATSGRLADFYRTALGEAQAMGNNDLITEVAGLLTGAQGSASTTNNTSSDVQAALDQANIRNDAITAENRSMSGFIATTYGPGDIGSGYGSAWAATGGSFNGGGGGFMGASDGAGASRQPNVVVNVKTLHPGDPSTLHAIGSAAAAGFGYQGNVKSSTQYTGL